METPKSFTLWYWVRGSPLDRVEFIQVPSDTLVATLRNRIRDECNIGAPATLYRVPKERTLRLNGEYEHDLGLISISALSLMRSPQRLVDMFTSEPEKDCLHLILVLDRSTGNPITCWVRGDDPSQFIAVALEPQDELSELKSKIKELSPRLSGVPLDGLRLYKISYKSEDELKGILDRVGDGDLISTTQVLGNVFDEIPFTSAVSKPVVVEIACSQRDTVQSARDRFLKDNMPEKPSAFATSFIRRQANDTTATPCGRPQNCMDCIPTTLLHPVFSQFIEDIENIQPTVDDQSLALHLTDFMSVVYPDKSERVEKIQSILNFHDIHLMITETAGYEPDGDMSTKGFRYVIAEFENASSWADPYFRAIGHYLESTRLNALNMPHSPLPCLLLSIFGPYIIFYGAVWNRRPPAQLLLMPIGFYPYGTAVDNSPILERHMAALRNAIQTLKKYYETPQPPPSLSVVPHPQLFPCYVTSSRAPTPGSKSGADSEPMTKTIVYREQLSQNELVFFGSEGSSTGDRICIKFFRQYSAEAHDYCKFLGCAPTLRGSEKLPGGWHMVVMDDLSDKYEPLYLKGVSTTTRQLIEEKLARFHDAGYVHGDIRDTNIMVSKSNPKDFKIIDFSWAGKAQEAKYPPRVNRDVWRPQDAFYGKPILVEHDNAMLCRMGGTG